MHSFDWKKFLFHITFFTFLIGAVFWARGRFGAVIDVLIIFYTTVYIGFVLSKCSGQAISATFFTGLFHPRSYLRKKPVPMATVIGLISMRRYDEAEAMLLEIIRKHSDHVPSTLLLAQLYLDHQKNFSAAERLAETFLSNHKGALPEALPLVNVGVDACLAQNAVDRALALLRRELTRSGYSPTERRAMTVRCDALSTSL